MQEQVDERVSARFEKELTDQIDEVVQAKGYTNRSEFLRVAARALINAQQEEGTITVRLSGLTRDFLDKMVKRELYTSYEEVIVKALDCYLTPERIEEGLRKLDVLEKATGRKADVQVDDASRQIISQK